MSREGSTGHTHTHTHARVCSHVTLLLPLVPRPRNELTRYVLIGGKGRSRPSLRGRRRGRRRGGGSGSNRVTTKGYKGSLVRFVSFVIRFFCLSFVRNLTPCLFEFLIGTVKGESLGSVRMLQLKQFTSSVLWVKVLYKYPKGDTRPTAPMLDLLCTSDSNFLSITSSSISLRLFKVTSHYFRYCPP